MKDGVESLKSLGCSDKALLAVSSSKEASLLSFVHTITEDDNHPKDSDTPEEESAAEGDNDEGEIEFDDAKDEEASICNGNNNTKAGRTINESSDEEYEFEA